MTKHVTSAVHQREYCNLTEQTKIMWDIRARKAVCELATRSNTLVSLAWDPMKSALYAGTEHNYIDRMGNYHRYRKARTPRWALQDPTA